MSWYLVIFDETAGVHINSDGSEYFLNEHMIEANSPKQAVKKLLNVFCENESRDDVEVIINDMMYGGASVIELGLNKPNIKRVEK